ncbi:MAG: hypothetical protein ACM3SY_14020 [Candidatus Omnitrophota bacterium]
MIPERKCVVKRKKDQFLQWNFFLSLPEVDGSRSLVALTLSVIGVSGRMIAIPSHWLGRSLSKIDAAIPKVGDARYLVGDATSKVGDARYLVGAVIPKVGDARRLVGAAISKVSDAM